MSREPGVIPMPTPWIQQARLHGQEHGMRRVVRTELPKRPVNGRGDPLGGHEQLLGDLLVGVSEGYQVEDVQLMFGERRRGPAT
nr:hypothetical protein [Streptomyces glaucescens]